MRYFLVNGVPVAQENEPSSEFYTVDSWQEITSEQYNELLNPTPIEPSEFEVAKIAKQNELNVWAYTFVSNGYEDTETGYKLFCSETDVANYATLKNAIMDMADTDVVEIGTMTGWQTSTKGVVYPLLVRYSAYMLPFTTKYLKLKSYLEYATTIEEIEAIVI